MTNASKHIIEKFNLEFNTLSEDQGMQFEKQSIELFQHKLLPQIENVFERFGSDKNIRLDKLSIEINANDPIRFEDQFVEQFLEKLSKELEKASKNTRDSTENPLQVFEYFLDHGHFPWWAQETSIEQLENEMFKQKQSVNSILSLLKNDPQKRRRLVYQFNDIFLQTIVNQQFTKKKDLLDFKEKLQQVLSKFYQPIEVRNQLWFSLFEAIILQKQSIEEAKIFIFKTSIFNFSQNEKASKGNLIDLVLKELQIKDSDSFLKLQAASHGIKKGTKKAVLKTKFETESDFSKTSKEDQKKALNKSAVQNEWYIKNAGLVLLHPFLAMLFEGLGYTEKHVFKNTHLQNQAALLSQYLVTGMEQTFENELMLNKLFCDIPLTEPIEKNLILNDKIVAETEQLLNAVINHWSALKNTSPEGLRTTFLQREGKLSKNNDGSWKLFIQHNSFDILISKLPWSISIIKLPWMKNMLQVEWA